MKVLHYCNGFSGLSETFIYDYIIELERQGVDNYVLAHKRLYEEDRPFEKVEIVKYPSIWQPEMILRKIKSIIFNENPVKTPWPIIRRKMERILIEFDPDIVHAHFGPQGVKVAPVCKSLEIPFLTSFHGYDAFELTKQSFWDSQYIKMSNHCSAITCVSDYMSQKLKNDYEWNRLELIHVGKKLDNYTFKVSKGKIRKWISVGSLKEKKGHGDTIRAFSKIIDKFPNQTLRIIGGGFDRNKLNNLIEDLGLTEHVKLLGPLPHRDVINELVKADVFILASKKSESGDKEGIPTVLMEAQAVGLPCVSTEHSGIPEVIPKGSQKFLAEEGNVQDLAKKIELIINCNLNEIKEISLRGRKIIENQFNLQYEVKKLVNLYQNIA